MRNSILNILQVNVFRIQNKTLELNKALEEEIINITLMQETIQTINGISMSRKFMPFNGSCDKC